MKNSGSVLFHQREVVTEKRAYDFRHDFNPPQSFEIYGHRLFSNVVADVYRFTETRNGDGRVFFVRWNTDTNRRTPTLWPLDRFERFFSWGAAPNRFGQTGF